MLELLGENSIGQKFQTLKKGSAKISIAVAFWGNGALEELHLTRPQKARIICNLASSGCNPYVIEKLKKLKGVSVRSNSRLHAKIYAGADFVIVGSSNASTNGLGDEGDISNSWIEANVASDDPKLVQTTLAMFDKLWGDKKNTQTITAAALRKAKDAYDRRPPTIGSTNTATLLAACRENPHAFKHIFVGAYNAGLGKRGSEQLSIVKKGAVTPEDEPRAADFARAWGYQFGQKLPKGSWIIDLNCTGKMPKIYGCSEVTGLYARARGENDLMVTLRGVVVSPIDGRSLPLSLIEKKALIAIAGALVKQDKFVALPDILRLLDKKRAAPRK